MKSLDIVRQLEDLLKTGRLQHDLLELQQLRKQANNLLGLQVVYTGETGRFGSPRPAYTVSLKLNNQTFAQTFVAEADRGRHQQAVKDALRTLISDAVTSYILDDADVATQFFQHIK